MRLCTVRIPDDPQSYFGVELDRRILLVENAARVLGYEFKDVRKLVSLHQYLVELPSSEKLLRRILQQIAENPRALAKPTADGQRAFADKKEVTYLPPIERPGKFLCIGLNYVDHCLEQKKEPPKRPVVFNKFATSLLGHGAAIPLPHKVDKAIDFEAELAFVIGKTAKNVTKRSAMKHVAGYTIVNDVSARTLQKDEAQWARAKGFDGSGPYGPCIVTPDEVPDPHALAISLRLDGKLMQSSNTSNLVFKVPELIAFISAAITLEPGDIVSTGTPGGVGVYRNPPAFLQEGSKVQVTIERLGTLENTCVVA